MIQYAGFSVTGRKENGVNEDRILINGHIDDDLEGESATLMAVVLDGVGGEQYGNEAAQLAAQTFSVLAGSATDSDIQQAVHDANQAILLAQVAHPSHARMATTVAGVAINGSDYIVFNLGDSRVYHLGTYFSQLTRDHTYRRMLEDVAAGAVQVPSELSHVITRCLGAADGDKADMLLGHNQVRANDMFLLCSDGLHDVVSDEEMEAMLDAHEGSLLSLCKALARLAMDKGSLDNISIIICKVEDET